MLENKEFSQDELQLIEKALYMKTKRVIERCKNARESDNEEELTIAARQLDKYATLYNKVSEMLGEED